MNRLKIFFQHFEPLYKIFQSFSFRKQLQLVLLIPIFILQAITEIISIGAIIPFITSITNPNLIYSYLENFIFIKTILNIKAPDDVLFPFFIIFIFFIVFSGIFKLISNYLVLKVTYSAGSELSILIFKNNIYQYYSYFLKRDSNELINLVHSKSSRSMGVLLSIMQIINYLILLIFFFIFSVLVSPLISISSFILIGGSYILILILVKKLLNANSHVMAKTENILLECSRDIITQIRDVLLSKNFKYFENIFSVNIFKRNNASVSSLFISLSPKVLIETIGLTVLTVIAYILIKNQNNFIDLIPFFAVIGLAAQRLMPIFQQLYYSFAHIESEYETVLEVSHNIELKSYEKEILTINNSINNFNIIEFKDVCFSYGDKNILNNINLTIKKGQKIGIVGHTGSGKSTFIDLLMGLNFPKSGKIFIDKNELTMKNVNDWQKNISHVSQSFSLLNRTVKENIMFGSEDINYEDNLINTLISEVLLSSKISQLNNGVNERIGESGILISGGERQKIALARALYKNFNMLVLDEATSSLDNESEEIIMKNIYQNKNKTLIIIAHRLTTIKKCDIIFVFAEGKIVNAGTYSELLNTSNNFKELTKHIK